MTLLDHDTFITLFGCIAFPLAAFAALEFACRHIKAIERAPEARHDYPFNDPFDFLVLEEES